MRAGPFVLVSLCLAAISLTAHSAQVHLQAANASSPSPPSAPVRPVTDTYYQTKVTDPYRYMENLADSEVQSWLKAQNDYTRAVLARLPGRQQLLKRIVELDESTAYDVGSVLRLPGDFYLYSKLLAGEDTSKVYIRKGLKGEERLLADPERISIAKANRRKGARVIDYFAPSNDLKYVAVTIVPGGSEYDTEIHVIETASGRETGDVISRCCVKSNPMWLPDNRSFVYGRWQKLSPGAPATEVRQRSRCYLHVLGTDPEKDQPVFGYGVVPSIDVDPRHYSSIRTQPDSKYALGVIGTPVVSPNSAFYIAPVDTIGKSNTAWHRVADFSDEVSDVAIHGDDLYLLTFKDAPRYKIIHLDARRPDLSSADTIVRPGEAVIEGMASAQDALYVRELDGGIGRVSRTAYGAGSKIERLPLPFEGGVSLFDSDPRVPGTLLLLNSWTKASKIYAYDPSTRQVSDTKLQPTGPHDEFADVEAEEVKVSSYDGTLVPLSIAHPKRMKLDGSNPTILGAYGAYGISLGPEFDQMLLAWYERGGVNAVCHVRGGGEYGEEWHQAGKGATKPNTWLDFIACAQYLIDKKYTSPAHLAGEGASAGGIPIGRAITEKPDLFGAAIIDYGGVDMLRIDTTSNGAANTLEFGSTKTEEGFKGLYAMSPLQHVRDGTAYPAVLLTTGINDPRVNPWQPGKLAARLQAATTSGKPVLLYVDYGGGHGGSTEQQYQEDRANCWSFLLWQFGAIEFQPPR
jgi:prolyl oligopeptidase